MNTEQVNGLARDAVKIAGSFAVGAGFVKADTVTALLANPEMMGLIGALGMVAWGWIAKSNKNLTAAVAALPETKAIVTSPAIAEATPASPEVVASVKDIPKENAK